MNKEKLLDRRRERRAHRIRKKMHGDASRPRLSVFRSLKHISCQIVDDVAGKTLVSAGTQEPSLKAELKGGGNIAAAAIIGQAIAKRALEAGITQVQFDRGHFRYHGRVAALAGAARDAGLKL